MDATSTIEMATAVAKSYGLNSHVFLEVLKCESGLNAAAIGDNASSFGIAQIHISSHPEVSLQQAMSPFYSMVFMAKEWVAHRMWEWTCWKHLPLSPSDI